MSKHRIVDESKVDLDLRDPSGWTFEDNPYPYPFPDCDPSDRSDWRNWLEWQGDGISPSECHMCLRRAVFGSGNCQDNGEYFAPCRDRKLSKRKRTVQSKLM